ncbi:MAG: hypothetical protein Q8J90_08655 [Gallionella sp.]|nr:hypothetical protein [Gallionella sp.]
MEGIAVLALAAISSWDASLDRCAKRQKAASRPAESCSSEAASLGVWVWQALAEGRESMNAFIRGFIKGSKETPRGFFAPAIAVWRLLLDTTESLVNGKGKG